MTCNTIADFVVQPVTREIGCINGFTIQEFAGDVVFLAPDGLRTVAGTERIGDVELGTISRKIQRRFAGVTDVDEFDSVVIPDKTQYRIFFSKSSFTSTARFKYFKRIFFIESFFSTLVSISIAFDNAFNPR